MEELHDAIEDAQYMSAICNVYDGPRPVVPWSFPSEETLERWKAAVRSKWTDDGRCPEPFTFYWTLSSPLGLFLFSAFLKNSCRDHCQINFVEEVLRWRSLCGRQRAEKARTIVRLYLTHPIAPDGATTARLPAMTEIDEFDLELPPHALLPNERQLEQLLLENSDPSCSKCCIALDGPVRDALIARIPFIGTNSAMSSNQQTTSATEHGPQITQAAHQSQNESMPVLPPTAPSTIGVANASQQLSTRDHEVLPSSAPQHFADLASTRTFAPSLPAYLPDDTFDLAESIVLEMIREKYWDAFVAGAEEWYKLLNFLWYQDRKVVEEDFFVMRVLGRGGFGVVTACKKGTSGKLYAMKVMNKRRIKIKKSEQLTLNERAALAAVDSPFVVNLKYSFQSENDIFLILDLMTGGDLSFHLVQKRQFPKKECLYYAARIMLGLQALHDQNYVYRDLKPENCLLADDGRVKITDLGLATLIVPTLHGAAGTRGYWAPEMLRRDDKGRRLYYNHAVDWFSFGCVLAEFISGTNPFRSEAALNFGSTIGNVTKEKAIDFATLEMDPILDHSNFDDDAADICRQLMNKDPTQRIGANGCEEIMAHNWFKDVNWEMIITDRKKPPFVPAKHVNAASQSEIGTFVEDRTFHETVLEEEDEEVYKNWDWTNSKAFAAEVIEYLVYERDTGKPLVPLQSHSSCCCSIM